MPRTTKPAEGGKRYPLNMRTTKEMRDRLERAAAANGRSLAQEVELRLERTFQQDDFQAMVSFFETFAIGQELDEQKQQALEHLKQSHPAAWELAYAKNIGKVIEQQKDERRPRQITIKGKRGSRPAQIKLGRRSTASKQKERSHGR